MKQEIATTGLGGDLLEKMQSGIASSRAQTIISGGKPFLRMLKDGNWVFGQRDEEVQEGSSWAINVLSLQHGHCCWPKNEGGGTNKMLGEVMAPVYAPRPSAPEPINGFPFTQQVGFDARCLDGADMGTEVQYKNNSRGGINAFDKLLENIQKQLVANPNHPCPVVQLHKDHYDHATYGRIYIPIFEIVDWCDLAGKLQSEAANGKLAAPQPEREEAPPVAPVAAKTPVEPKASKPPVERKPAIGPKPGKETPRAARPAPEAPAPTARRRPVRR